MYAIFYKEWIKTRWYFLLAVITTLGFTGYCMLRINRVVEMKGAAHVWEVMMQRDAIFIEMLQYIPLIAGVLMAVVQFVPEMQRKCLKFDPASALSRTEDDGQYAVLRFSVAACLLCFQLPADGNLSKRSAGSRTEESYIADCPHVVSCRYFRIPARRMDLSRTGMETQNHQSHYHRAITANLLSVAHTGSFTTSSSRIYWFILC